MQKTRNSSRDDNENEVKGHPDVRPHVEKQYTEMMALAVRFEILQRINMKMNIDDAMLIFLCRVLIFCFLFPHVSPRRVFGLLTSFPKKEIVSLCGDQLALVGLLGAWDVLSIQQKSWHPKRTLSKGLRLLGNLSGDQIALVGLLGAWGVFPSYPSYKSRDIPKEKLTKVCVC